MPELNTDYGVDLLGTAMKATTVKRKLLENAILEQKSKELPDILQHEKEQRAMERTQGKQAITSNMFKLAKDASNFYLPKMNLDNWDAMKPQIEATFAKIGMPVSIPTRADIETRAAREKITPEAAAEAEKFESLAELDQLQKQYGLVTERTSAEAKEKKVPQIKAVDLGDKVQIYEDGVLTKTVSKGKVPGAEKGDKSGQNWILPNRSTVISYDGGKTYATSNGQSRAMPVNAVKVPGGATLEEIRMNEAKQEARAELEEGQAGARRSPKQAALSGTGPYERVASAFEAVAGGLGLDLLVGEQGFFPDMADAKQYLRSVKQIGKSALMNSSRGAIWEQQRIDELFPDPDKTFTNPRIEARKFGNLRDILTSEKTYNNQAIMQAISPKEAEKYRTSNNEIDRLMALISEPSIGGINAQEKALIDKYLKRGK